MRTNAFIPIVAALLLSACGDGETPAPQPEQTVQQLMANEVQPTAEIYWNAVRYISDETGNHDYFPESDEEWEAVRAAAVKLADYGRLLETPAYTEGRGEDWLAFTNGLIEVSALAEQAAIEKDVDKVFEVGGTVYNVCRACHQSYPPENLPE